jgi:hypothetical protein
MNSLKVRAFLGFVIVILMNLSSAAKLRAQAPELTIDRSLGLTRLAIRDEPGSEYTLEASSDALNSSQWEPLITAAPTNRFWTWLDSASAQAPRRFYRVTKPADAEPPMATTDFRLIDHLGRAHHLEYSLAEPAVRAVVLIFTADDCAQVDEMLAPIKSLRDQFVPQGVQFWMIDSIPADTRSNIVAGAAARGIDLPILHDPAQLVAREYGATAAPEIFVLKRQSAGGPTDWAVGYRGCVDDRTGASPTDTTQYYLSNALAAVVSDQPVIVTRAEFGGCAIPRDPPRQVSYSGDIAPLLAAHCVRCHSSGNIAPWSMTNYDIVHAYAPLIKSKVLKGEMPPWHADPYYGSFANDFSLTPQQKANLVQWINNGAPRGDGPDPLAVAAPPTNYPFAWPASLGAPDLVLTIPAQTIPAAGVLDYRYFDVPTGLATDAWVRAAVILPGNTKVVHHSLAFFGSDAIFKGLLGFFAIYVPGYDPVVSPEGTAKLLPKGTVLQAQMHYVATGQEETDQTRIGLYFSSSPPQSVLQTKSAVNINFSIPPGLPETRTNATYTFTKDSMLYEMVPHMHLRGSWFRYELLYPDQTRETVLSVPHYDFMWQTLYRLAEPKFVPAGTQLICTGAWDNSAMNPDNPDPTATVTFGEQTFNEMFIGYFSFAEIP